MSTLHALVDYFNVADLPTHRTPTYRDHQEAVKGLAAAVEAQVRALRPAPRTLHIRLYGGWHEETTDDLTEARQELGAISRSDYPTPRPQRIFIHPADSLMALPQHRLRHTLRLWNGLGSFRLKQPDDCALRDNCAIAALDEWRRGRCPNRPSCPVKARSAVLTERQKLVDTAMVADTIHLARNSSADWVAVVSNDDDVIPGLIAGASDHARLLLFTMNRSQPSSYAPLLEQLSVGYRQLDSRNTP